MILTASPLCLWGGADLNLLREEVRLYSCTPRNFSVSLREELKRTDAIFWPSCLLVKRCGGNCACCSHRCYDCQCVPTRVTKKYHEVKHQRHQLNNLKGLNDTLIHTCNINIMCKFVWLNHYSFYWFTLTQHDRNKRSKNSRMSN